MLRKIYKPVSNTTHFVFLECLHTSTTKGNLKSHILSGRHKLFQKSHPCSYCPRSYSTRQSLQVHVSTHHRYERDAHYHNEASQV